MIGPKKSGVPCEILYLQQLQFLGKNVSDNMTVSNIRKGHGNSLNYLKDKIAGQKIGCDIAIKYMLFFLQQWSHCSIAMCCSEIPK